MNASRLATTIPVLPSADFDTTAAFYQRLGFIEHARYPDEYLILKHPDGIELHFWLHQLLEPLANDSSCYIRFVSAAESRRLHEQWTALQLDSGSIGPQQDSGYNLLEFAVFDPHRNLLRVGGVIRQ